MVRPPYRGRRGGERYQNHARRYSRSPSRSRYSHPRSPTTDGRRDFGRSEHHRRRYRDGSADHRRHYRDRSEDCERGRRPVVNLLPRDHPLISEITRLKEVRWQRLLEWIDLARRLGRDWDHRNSPDFRQFCEEEKMATEQLEKLAGAIALAEHNLSFDQEPTRREEESTPKQLAPRKRKRKADDGHQVWTEEKTGAKVEAWMKSVGVKPLDKEKPILPVVIGSSDAEDELFLHDDSSELVIRASNSLTLQHDNDTDIGKSTEIAKATDPTKAISSDSFSTTRARADELLHGLEPNLQVPIKANTRLPPPPVNPLPDLPEVPTPEELNKGPASSTFGEPRVGSVQAAGDQSKTPRRATGVDPTAARATPEEAPNPSDQEFNLASFLRWLNGGGTILGAVPRAAEQPSMAATAEASTRVTASAAAGNVPAVKQEPMEVHELLRALANTGRP